MKRVKSIALTTLVIFIAGFSVSACNERSEIRTEVTTDKDTNLDGRTDTTIKHETTTDLE